MSFLTSFLFPATLFALMYTSGVALTWTAVHIARSLRLAIKRWL